MKSKHLYSLSHLWYDLHLPLAIKSPFTYVMMFSPVVRVKVFQAPMAHLRLILSSDFWMTETSVLLWTYGWVDSLGYLTLKGSQNTLL